MILALRHAEVHNPKDIVYGRLPRFGLSPRGRAQAELAGRFLLARPIAAIYTSPLLRARQTATIVARYHQHLRVRTSRALLEVRSGYQGEPNAIYQQPDFSFYEPLSDPADESMAGVCDRMLGFLSTLARRHVGETVLFVSHADPITIMRLGLEGEPLTVPHLHSAVYAARASVLQIYIDAISPPRLTYFDVVGEGPT